VNEREPSASDALTAPASRVEGGASVRRPWSVVLLTAAEPGRRHRRTIDAVLLSVGALLAGLASVVAASAPETDEEVAQALTTVLGWAGALWRTAFSARSFSPR
jgi:hypothetical protein